MNRWYFTFKYALTVWQVSSFSLYSMAVDKCFSTDVLLCSVGKCLIQKVSNELTSSLASNWRN